MRVESAVEPTRSEKHHCDLAALGAILRREAWGIGRSRSISGSRFAARIGSQCGDGIEQLEPVPDCCDAKLLQGLVRQARKDRLVYLVLAERSLILREAKAPQPDHDVHEGRPSIMGRAHHPPT